MRALGTQGHDVTTFEPAHGWSVENLRTEAEGERSLTQYRSTYPELKVKLYREGDGEAYWQERLANVEVVILHEWNPPELAELLLKLREQLGFALLFHDTHHRATSSPEQMERFGLRRFDGVLAFGEALRSIYRERYDLTRVWTLHEAADETVFKPLAAREKRLDVVWVGNWGEGERTREISEYLLHPIARLQPNVRARIYGVRYPDDGLAALRDAGVEYGGYLPNLDAPEVYAGARMTVHVPRLQYTGAIEGVPTIRVFEALACGVPLLSAPWRDTEHLFRTSDLWMVESGAEMFEAMRSLLRDPARAAEQAHSGLETVLSRHTCAHRAQELTEILGEVRA